MQIRLTRKLAEAIDGIDLSRRHVGELMDVPQWDADTLVAEGWATPASADGIGAASPHDVKSRSSDRISRHGHGRAMLTGHPRTKTST
jgi:hypothetical protein